MSLDAPLLAPEAGSGKAHINPAGYSVAKAVLLNVGTVAGAGVLSMPVAFMGAGWVSVGLVVFCACLSAYTALVEGWIQNLIRDRVSDTTYEAYGREAYGKAGENVVIVCKHFTLVGVSIAFLILCGENMTLLFPGLGHFGGLLVSALIITPGTWYPTLNGTVSFAIIAVVATVFAVLAVLVAILLQPGAVPPPAPVTFGSFAVAFGQIAFSFSGHANYPAVQREMYRPSDFSKAVAPTYFSLVALYLPVAVIGFAKFAGHTRDNILHNIADHPNTLTRLITAGITINVLFSYILVQYPVSRTLHRLTGIPDDKFTPRLVAMRTSQVAFALLVAWAVPFFGTVLGLLGGSTITLVTFILPCVFYEKLARDQLNPRTRAVLITCIVFGVLAGLAATGSSAYMLVDQLINGHHHHK